jgi:hypothetical protein
MHAQQSFLNVCNTAILEYHGDKIILYKNVKNIKCQYQVVDFIKINYASSNYVGFIKIYTWGVWCAACKKDWCHTACRISKYLHATAQHFACCPKLGHLIRCIA